jgi:probable addiction module antidote protein
MTKQTIKITKWDMADYIENEEDIIAHLNAALEENDMEILLTTIGAIARSDCGMGKLAQQIGVSRESLYKTLSSKGNPSFSTIIRALNFLGYEIKIQRRV